MTLIQPGMAKVGRNDSCPCGSGAKYKKRCQARDEAARAAAPPPATPPTVPPGWASEANALSWQRQVLREFKGKQRPLPLSDASRQRLQSFVEGEGQTKEAWLRCLP